VLDPNNDLPGFGGTANLAPCPGATTNLTGLGGSLSPFTVTVTCNAAINAPTTEGNRNVAAYLVVATACNQPAAGACPNPAPASGYIERQVQATLSKCKDPTAAGPRFSCS